MRTSNPALNDKAFETQYEYDTARSSVMTLDGTVIKTGILLLFLVGSGAVAWNFASQNPALMMPFVLGGAIGGLILSLITIFKPVASPYTAPLYAIAEGLFLGVISLMFESQFQGIVLQAVGLTVCTLASLLLAYTTGLIKATENFRLGVFAATAGIGMVYLVTLVLHLFGINVPYIHDSGLIGIGFSLFVVVVAALNLVLDFDFIERGVERSAPKYMEWYAGFGLLVTLVWLYLEILRLLSKLRDR